jgi:hypothetical protein
MEFKTNIEDFLEDLIGSVYLKYKKDNKDEDEKELKDIIQTKIGDYLINPYTLYSMKILKIIDKEINQNIYFDQVEGFTRLKTIHREGNEFISDNEIYAVLNELSDIPQNKIVHKHICSRIRVLSILNVWDDWIDCDTYSLEMKESDRYLEECKKYFLHNTKYLRYSRLLKAALNNAALFEHLGILPINLKEFRTFLRSPLIYVMLEPYNYILNIKDFLNENENNVIKGILIEGELVFY